MPACAGMTGGGRVPVEMGGLAQRRCQLRAAWDKKFFGSFF